VCHVLTLLLCALSARAELPEIRDFPPDLTVPETTNAAPAPGLRVRQTTADWEATQVHHTIYLPANWTSTGQWPVIVEYAGNGDFQNSFGDRCDGSVEGCAMGYGLSAGRDFIWLCLPFVEVSDGTKRNAKKWWGDPDESVRYTVATVRDVCAKFGGDPRRVVLTGFSRGSIGCNFIGLRNDEIAALWCGMLCHSHYDGVRSWPYPESDRESAKVRLLRLKGRPQFISQESETGTGATEEYLRDTGVPGHFTFVPFPYRNHTDIWALRDCEFRRKARAWLAETVKRSEGRTTNNTNKNE
jgi:hypothetical protein